MDFACVVAVCNVLGDARVEEHWLLGDDSQLASVPLEVQTPNLLTVHSLEMVKMIIEDQILGHEIRK